MRFNADKAIYLLLAALAACGGGGDPSPAGSKSAPTNQSASGALATDTPVSEVASAGAPAAASSPGTTSTGNSVIGASVKSVFVNDAFSFSPALSNPVNGVSSYSVSNKPAWLNFDAASGVLSGLPSAADAGVQTDVTIRALGADGAILATTTVSIQVKPSAPVVTKLELAQTHVVPAEGRTWDLPSLAGQSLHLTGDRDALVLVDLSSDSGKVDAPVLSASLGGVVNSTVTLNPPNTLPATEANGAAYSTTAWWARLDRSMVRTGLQLTVRANAGQASLPRPVTVGPPNVFTMYTLPFYLFGLTEASIPLSVTGAPDAVTRNEYFAKHPFSQLDMINHPFQKVVWPYIVVGPRQGRVAQYVTYMEQQGDGYAVMSAVLSVLGALRTANGDAPLNNLYYAPLLMARQSGAYGSPGGGLGGGEVGTGDYAYTGVFIHENGHAFGMPHANDGYVAGNYPYVGGSLKGSGWGYDANRNEFLSPLVPVTASTYSGCVSQAFPMGRQLDASGRCIKQDPMQSGAGDQTPGSKYTMFSDYNASVVQRYLEGTTTLSNGKKVYSGGKLVADASSATGYSRWDSIAATNVAADITTTDGGLYGFDRGLPLVRDVPVHAIVMTASLASVVETSDPSSLTYADTVTYDPVLTQIYPTLSGTGNLLRQFDPTIAADRLAITPNTGTYWWYCRNSGCDYSLRVTFADNSVQHLILQKGFRGWFSDAIPASVNDLTQGSGHRLWAVNVSAVKALKKIELLETPEVYKGFPVSPKVIATRNVP